MASQYDITIEQGATFLRTVTWRDSLGALINLSGYTARMQVRAKKSSDVVLVEANTTNGYIVLGGAAGTIAITIPAAITAPLSFVNGVYDLEVVSGGGIVTRLLEGGVELSKEVTR